MRIDIKRSQIFQELSSDLQEKYFNCAETKFLHNVDSLYYNVFLENDSNGNLELVDLIKELDLLKEKLRDNTALDDIVFEDLNVCRGSYAEIYTYRLSEPDMFDIFITSYLPNPNTPRIVVQLRSEYLWLDGVYSALEESFLRVQEIFEKYNCDVLCTLENRFDYAYHTNAIQNPLRFFSTDNLMKSLNTSLEKIHQIGTISKSKSNKRISDITGDYVGLGSRKANNAFVRIYNKTKEVVEQGYKSFFIDIWHQNKMISYYDKYCLEYAYKEKSFNSLDTARLNFYLEYGTDDRIKNEIFLIFKNENIKHSDIKDLADTITPKITLILNIEFETKRKFYYYASSQIDSFPCRCDINALSRLYKIYQNRNIFLDYLTSKTVSFIKEFKKVEKTLYNYIGEDKKVYEKEVVYSAWWKRLRSLKLKDCNNLGHVYTKEYARNLDLEKSTNRTMNSLATTSIYKGNINTTFIEDFSDMLGMINDNDLKNNNRSIAFVDKENGLIIDYIDNKFIEKYDNKKQKKYRELKNRISSVCPDHKNS